MTVPTSVRVRHTLSKRMTPMSKTLTPSANFVTSRDPKGTKFLDVVGAAYTKNLLTEAEAQRVNEAGGLSDLIDGYITQHRHEVPPILKLVAKAIKVSGAKRFTANKASLKKANICLTRTSDNFDQHFLGKVEENVADDTLVVHRLVHRLGKRSLDAQIRRELGQKRQEIMLTHFFDLLKKQSKGGTGYLLVNGYANIAYIRDKDGTLWAVRANWNFCFHCWSVCAPSVGNPVRWSSGYQVVSRDC